jgi:uncharacterized protein involved in response to NO
MLAAFIASGLVFLALPGTLLGVWNLVSISEHHSPTAPATAWIQAHGQAQLFGWVGTFILGISLYVLPKFRGRSLRSFGRAWAVWILWTTGAAWHWLAVVYTWHWRAALVGSAALEFAAYAGALWVIFAPGRAGRPGEKSVPEDLGSWLGIFGFTGFGIALAANFVISLRVALAGVSPAYPLVADRVFLLLCLWAFIAPVAWGYSTRFVTIFLSLEPPDRRAAPWLGIGVLAIVVGARGRPRAGGGQGRCACSGLPRDRRKSPASIAITPPSCGSRSSGSSWRRCLASPPIWILRCEGWAAHRGTQ